MGNVSISTNIERLQPPYKVIMHGNKIGVQIGVQTVTSIDNETLETRKSIKHPMVAVERKISSFEKEPLSIDASTVGEIWSDVEENGWKL